MGQFDGKVAIVTGGSSGIGRAVALAFAREGASVAVASRRKMESEETVDILEQEGGKGIFVQTDVSRGSDIENLIRQTVDHYGRLDFAFNNAGIGPSELVLTADITEEDFDRTIATNLKSVWLCMKYELPEICKQGGAIVNNASVAGLVGNAPGADYVASKHGVVGLTKCTARQYARKGVRINAVCPGLVLTEQVQEFMDKFPDKRDRMIKGNPVARAGTPEEIAAAVMWLCSDGAGFTVGIAMPVDGGTIA